MLIKYLVRTIEEDRLNYVKDKDDQIVIFDSFEEAYKETGNALKGFVERIDLSEEFIIFDENDFIDDEDKGYIRQNYHIVNLYEILNEINRDRSAEWKDFDQMDFEEGLEEFTDWTLIGTLKRVDNKGKIDKLKEKC